MMTTVSEHPLPPSTTGPGGVTVVAVLVLATVITFSPILSGDFIRYSDTNLYVLENPHVRQGLTWDSVRWAWQGRCAGNWHPLTMLSHMLDVTLFGANPQGHLAHNLLLHCLNTLLVFLLACRVVGRRLPAALLAVLFSLHPLRVESVAWVAERKDLLCAFFWLLSILAYLRYALLRSSRATSSGPSVGTPSPHRPSPSSPPSPSLPRSSPGTSPGASSSVAASAPISLSTASSTPTPAEPSSLPRSRGGGGWLLLSLLTFLLALLAKPMAVTQPFLLVLLDYWPLRRMTAAHTAAINGRRFLRCCLEKLPFFLLSLAGSIVTLLAQQESGAVDSAPLTDRLAHAVIGYGSYLWKTIYPVGLTFLYAAPKTIPWLTVTLLAAGLVAATILFWRWRRSRPWWLTGWLWYLGTLFPVIGLVRIGHQPYNDRYTYIPIIGLLIPLGYQLSQSLWDSKPLRRVALVVMVLLSGVLGMITWVQAGYWQNDESLYQHTLRVTERNESALRNYGLYLLKTKNDIPAAHRCFQQYVRASETNHRALYLLGTTHYLLGDDAAGASCYRLAMQQDPTRGVFFDLAPLLARQGRPEIAIKALRQLVAADPPDRNNALAMLGDLYARQQQYDRARDTFLQLIAADPSNAIAHYAVADLSLTLNDPNTAREYFRKTLQLAPAHPKASAALDRLEHVDGSDRSDGLELP